MSSWSGAARECSRLSQEQSRNERVSRRTRKELFPASVIDKGQRLSPYIYRDPAPTDRIGLVRVFPTLGLGSRGRSCRLLPQGLRPRKGGGSIISKTGVNILGENRKDVLIWGRTSCPPRPVA